jgi:glycosyltransferase involved in cell wall biosynthesis
MNSFDAHLYGPFFSESGVGESTRAYWRTLVATGLKVGILPQNPPFSENERFIAEKYKKYLVNDVHPGINLFRINAEEVRNTQVLGSIQKEAKSILIPMWETPVLPKIWLSDLQQFSHIIAATNFIGDAFSGANQEIPISIIPHEVHVPEFSRKTHRMMGLPDDRRIHLYSFSYASFSSRKNPRAFLEIKKLYCENFQFGKDLFVLTASDIPKSFADIKMHQYLEKSQDLNFKYFPGGSSREDHISLMANANSFISTHRSEGIGLQIVESILLGTPVVTHAYSGPADFIEGSDSGVFPFSTILIQNDEYPYSEGQAWADYKIEDILDTLIKMKNLIEVDNEIFIRVSHHFSITRTASLFTNFLNSFL